MPEMADVHKQISDVKDKRERSSPMVGMTAPRTTN